MTRYVILFLALCAAALAQGVYPPRTGLPSGGGGTTYTSDGTGLVTVTGTQLGLNTTVVPRVDTNQAITSTWDFTNGRIVLTPSTIPLPTCSTTKWTVIATNAASPADCSVGGGTSAAVCYCNGSGTYLAGSVASGGAAAWGSITGTLSSQTDLNTALSAKAPLASPTFTGTVTMPAPTLNNVTGSTQCLHVNTSGAVSGTGSDCGSGGSGANANGYYVVTQAANAPANAVNLGALTTGILKLTISGGVATPSTAAAGDFPTLNQNTSGTAANLSGTPALPNGTTATTQTAADNSTKLATTAYVDGGLGSKVATSTTVNGHALSSNVTVTASDVSLGSVTNDAQTKAAIVPNTAPSAGQILVGNAGGTAYAPVSASGDCTVASTGAITCTKLNNVSVATAATASTIAERNASGEVIAANTVATGKTPMATDTVLASGQIPKADVMDAPFFCSDAGANDSYACNLSPAITAYVTGTHYRFKANTANTGSASIALNSLAALTIKKLAGGITTDLADNDIRAGQYVECVYDGTNCQMISQLGNAGSGSGTVNSGTANQLAYYASSTNAVSGTTALPNGTTATTQSQADASTKVATTAYVDTLGRYTPTGSGAVSTALGSFDKNCPTPEAYGAVGDGTTDDATALQNLITNNNCINLPFGKTYKFNTGLTISTKLGFELRGHGSSEANGGSKLLYGGGSTTTAITFDSNRGPGCYIHDFQLDANGANGIAVVGSASVSAHSCDFERIQIFNAKGTPGVALQVGDTNDRDVAQNTFRKIGCTDSKICVRQQGTQTVNNQYEKFVVLGFSDRGMVFEKGDVKVYGGIFDGDAYLTTGGTADIEIGANVLYATVRDTYHEFYIRDLAHSCAKRTPSTASAISFPSGARAWSTNISNVRVLWGLDGGKVIDYHQQGPLQIDAPNFDAGVNPSGCSAVTISSAVTLANGSGASQGLFIGPGRMDSAFSYSITGPWVTMRAPLTTESVWSLTGFAVTANSSITESGLTITRAAGTPLASDYLNLVGDYTSNVSTALPGIAFKGGKMYPATPISWPSIQVGDNGYALIFRGGASDVAPNAAGMSFDTASGILFTWGATEFARADTNGYWHMKFPTSCTGLSSGMAYNNGTAIVPCP